MMRAVALALLLTSPTLAAVTYRGAYVRPRASVTTTSTTAASTSTSTSTSTSSSSSSSTAASTSTSTSTSTAAGTTTTTLADETTFGLLIPNGVATSDNGGSNTLVCAKYVPRLSKANLSSIAYGISGGTGTCGAAIYDMAGNTVGRGSVTCPTSRGIARITGISSFTLLGGANATAYWFCVCNSAGANYDAVQGAQTDNLMNAFQNNTVTGTACTSGVPQSTLGSTTVTANRGPVLWVE